MRKTFVFIISLLFILINGTTIKGQDSVQFGDSVIIPLKIRIGIEVAGPVIYFTDKNILNVEGHLSTDINEKISIYLGGGYSNYKYSPYNYSFLSSGFFAKAGVDFNLMKPKKSKGRYWTGIGIHYGLSSYTSEIPYFKHDNYWGSASSSVGQSRSLGHFIEASPGFRAEIFKYMTIGWSLTLKKLISSGTSQDLKPLYLPGYGAGAKSVSTGINYYLIFTIPYKKIKVIIKPEPVEEPVE
jgi:hypothetical protein